MKTWLMSVVFLSMLNSVDAQAKEGTYPIYPKIQNLINNLKSNCSSADLKENYPYKQLIKYKNKKYIKESSEYLLMEQLEWVQFMSEARCKVALAQNTIEGMNFIISNRPSNSFMHSDTHRAIARAKEILWLYDSNDSEQLLDEALASINTYLKSPGDYRADEEIWYYFVAENLLSTADLDIYSKYPLILKGTNTKKISKLINLAHQYAQQGYDLAKNKKLLQETLVNSLILKAQHQNTNSTEQTQALQDIKKHKDLFSLNNSNYSDVAQIYAIRGDIPKMREWALNYSGHYCRWISDKEQFQQFPPDVKTWLISNAQCRSYF